MSPRSRSGLVVLLCASLGACTSSGGNSGDDSGGGSGGSKGGSGGASGGSGGGSGGSSGGSGGGSAGNAAGSGGSGGNTAGGSGGSAGSAGAGGTPQAGSGGAVDGAFPQRPIDTKGWGEGFKVNVPAGVMIQPGGTQYLTAPKLATPALPVWSGISRTMNLLTTSNAQKRNTVKILFYGQSITRQEWYVTVTDYLKQNYPNADIQTWMLASGGQDALHMRMASAHDVTPLYPDLIIYQNYGGYADINGIVSDWRSQTTAEVLVQNWHQGSDAGNAGVDRMSYLFIPDVCRRLGAEFLDVRTIFADYVKAKNLQPAGLTADGTHLNAEGMTLMAKAHDDLFKNFPANTIVDPLGMVQTFQVGTDIKWNGGKITVDFEGNRVDAIAMNGATIPAGVADILVDGKKPSEFDGNYAFTRPNYDGKAIDKPEPGWPWVDGAPMRIDFMKRLVVEDWTLTLSGQNFTVKGSVTGNDGSGSMGADFASPSGRVLIKKDAWFMMKTNTVTWKAISLSTDTYPPQMVAATDSKLEYATRLFQGLPNARHKLEITSKDGKPVAIGALRFFRPPLKL